ncbi:putative nucleotide-diphospho-sugar transferase [Lederbergia graminis]|uniref:Nucleotide-diphospho-sugar transferase n=1 Tax=Lederbergia graminis TaxID=735518 RepID=A0ABW0LKG9_9BACI
MFNTVIGDTKNNDNLNHICVTASKDYILRILAMYYSLVTHSKNFKLWVCCMDQETISFLKEMNFQHMVIFSVKEVEDINLRLIKQQRKLNEYCWTLKAPLIHYLLTRYNLESVLYCDGDIYFFSDPNEIFEEWGNASIYLCPQRDAEWVEKKYGKYQAGVIGFRHDTIGLESLKWWQKKCEEWCFALPDKERFGDQKYLDEIPNMFSNVRISEHLGIDAAPWNCIYNNNYRIEKKNDSLYIEKNKLVAYHFACFSIFNEDEFDLWSLDTLKIRSTIKNNIYIPYIEKIREIIQDLKNRGYDVNHFYSKKSNVKSYYKYTTFRRKMDQTDEFYCMATIISKEYLVKGLAFHQSLLNLGDEFHLWICCMDSESLNILSKLNLKNVTLIPVSEIENNMIAKLSEKRSLTECCWTMKAPLCEHILKHYSEIDYIIYCDADMYFFSSPKPILDEWSTYSIFLCKQRSTRMIEHKHGIYQAGLLGFKREENSLKILKWWKEKCLEWCYDQYEDDKWGDQKYLNKIPNKFINIKVIQNIGIDAAPWNIVMVDGNDVTRKGSRILIENTEIVCFHFGSLLMLSENEYDLWKLEELTFTKSILKNLYNPYIKALQQKYEELLSIDNTIHYLSHTAPDYTPMNVHKF